MILRHDAVASKDASSLLTYATFTVSGDSVVPNFWTEYFEITPDIAVTKGHSFVTPSGRASKTPGRTGVWGITSKSIVTVNSIDLHLLNLIDRLKLPRSDLATLLLDHGAKIRVLCYWANYSGSPVPQISENLRRTFESSGGVVEIDQYPQVHIFRSPDGDEEIIV
jgi:Domain of unknown function (DUF4279)